MAQESNEHRHEHIVTDEGTLNLYFHHVNSFRVDFDAYLWNNRFYKGYVYLTRMGPGKPYHIGHVSEISTLNRGNVPAKNQNAIADTVAFMVNGYLADHPEVLERIVKCDIVSEYMREQLAMAKAQTAESLARSRVNEAFQNMNRIEKEHADVTDWYDYADKTS